MGKFTIRECESFLKQCTEEEIGFSRNKYDFLKMRFKDDNERADFLTTILNYPGFEWVSQFVVSDLTEIVQKHDNPEVQWLEAIWKYATEIAPNLENFPLREISDIFKFSQTDETKKWFSEKLYFRATIDDITEIDRNWAYHGLCILLDVDPQLLKDLEESKNGLKKVIEKNDKENNDPESAACFLEQLQKEREPKVEYKPRSTETEIQHPWCVYGYLQLNHIGKITEEFSTSVFVTKNERSPYAEGWQKKGMKRFPTLEEAVDYLKKHKPKYDIRERPVTDADIDRWARQSFPSQYKQE